MPGPEGMLRTEEHDRKKKRLPEAAADFLLSLDVALGALLRALLRKVLLDVGYLLLSGTFRLDLLFVLIDLVKPTTNQCQKAKEKED